MKLRLKKVFPYIFLSIVAVLFLLPLLWLITSTFDTDASVSLKFPKNLTMENLSGIIGDVSIQKSFLIGLILSGGQTILVTIVAVLASYSLSRFKLKLNGPFLYIILFMTSLPMTAVMVPVYQLFILAKFDDSILATMLFLAASSLPYAIWMMKSFMDSVPIELEESAWIDGASMLKGLVKVVSPLMLPGIFTVAIFTFAGSWGNFFVPFILIQSPDKLPASVQIFQYFGQYGMVEYGGLAAYSLLYTMPAVILYIIGQRYMSEGFSLGGANKG